MTGYSQQRVTVVDGNQTYPRLLKDFLDSWNVLGNMAVIFDGEK